MRRFFPLLVVAGTFACASSGSTPDPGIPSPSDRVVATDNTTTYRTTVTPNAKVLIPAAPGRVYDAVKAVFAELGVPSGTDDPTTGRVGNPNFWKSHKFGNETISTYLNCGNSITGSAADNYRVYMSLMAVVRPDGGGGSQLETAFTAQAQNMEGTAGDRIVCGTTGRLEERIRRAVLLKVGG